MRGLGSRAGGGGMSAGLDEACRTRLLAVVVEATVAAGFIVWEHFCRTSAVEYLLGGHGGARQ